MPDGDSGRTLRDAGALIEAGLMTPEDRAAIEAVAARYAVAIPPAFRALIEAADDPIGLQVVPSAAELVTAPHESVDPIADEALSPVPGIVHRYPDRVLLKPLLACPLYCRFCFRREQVGPGGGVLSEAEIAAALAYVAARPAIREVILTGGDPLMLSARRLGGLLRRIEAIPHVELLRIHSRVPMAAPELVTPALVAAMALETPLYLAVHANHAREFSGEAARALRRIAGAGVVMLGQTVLLRGVNDSVAALEGLFRTMLRHRIKPYYLHQLDPAPGTARFAVPVEEGRRLLAGLRGRVTGLAWPTYVQDRGREGKAVVPPLAGEWAGG